MLLLHTWIYSSGSSLLTLTARNFIIFLAIIFTHGYLFIGFSANPFNVYFFILLGIPGYFVSKFLLLIRRGTSNPSDEFY